MKGLKTISKGLLIARGLKLITKGLSYGKGVLINIGVLPPNYSDIIRYFTSREGNTLKARIGSDADLLLPDTVFEANGTLTHPNLTGVNIVRYEGTANLSISGNDLIADEGTTVRNLLLDTGEFYPLPYLGVGEVIEFKAAFNKALDFSAPLNFNDVMNFNTI